MARTIEEWQGRNDDARPPRSVYRRKFQEADGKCQECHRTVYSADSWELDHIVRLKDGGGNREKNLRVLCSWCHALKTGRENSQGAKSNRIFDRAHGIKSRPGPFARLRAWRDRILAEREAKGDHNAE